MRLLVLHNFIEVSSEILICNFLLPILLAISTFYSWPVWVFTIGERWEKNWSGDPWTLVKILSRHHRDIQKNYFLPAATDMMQPVIHIVKIH